MHLVVFGYLLAVIMKQACTPDKVLDCSCPTTDKYERMVQKIQSHGIIISETRKRVLCIYKTFCTNMKHKHQHASPHSDHQKMLETSKEEKNTIVWNLLLRSRYHETFFGIVASDMLLRWDSSSNLLVLAAFCFFCAIEVANIVVAS